VAGLLVKKKITRVCEIERLHKPVRFGRGHPPAPEVCTCSPPGTSTPFAATSAELPPRPLPTRPHSATAHPPPHVQILVVTGLPLQPLSSNARVDSERQNDTTTSFGSSVPLRATSSVLAHRPQSSPPPPLPCWRTTCPHASTDHPRSRCARAHPGSCRPEQHSSPGLARFYSPKRRRCGVHLQFTLRDSTPPEEASESSAARR
jgi:hypothetical protein